ncbi:phage terminase large subunit [Pseudodesulfovibrio sp.]|uniref:phage terminase large subunit n=1 Tax=Pseudodesulfovibrio sp. TaxID=2035812 RepID=UPI00261EBEE5|nr:phage terminase large subunit [Pseudodesulfovibrio sp.]MDD3310965.1 phage terminase large subunit [Pseudodesulfovibrio sp.]
MGKPRHKELAPLLKERELRTLRAEQARRNMAAFVSFTKEDYVHNSFSLPVCVALDVFLEDVFAGLRPVLVLQAPPQHGKSELVSRRFPPYAFGRYPNLRFAAASYGADLARDMNRDVQRIMMEDSYKAVFPDSALNPRRAVTIEGQALRNAERFDILGHRGYYVCTGVGGPLTGKSVDIGVIDDPIKNQEEARSDTIKRAILSWYNTVFLTRLSKLSGHIIMATSWAVDDLSATVIKKNPKARHLKFPAIDQDGNALVPELHPLDKLLETKASLTPAEWSALYMQSPVREGGNIFQEDWVKRWNKSTLPDHFDEVIQSWDMTFKDTDGSDYVVGQVWGRKRTNYYLLHQVRDRMGFTRSKDAVKIVSAQFPQSTGVLIEDKANGPAVMDALKEDISGLIPIEPDGSKVARAHAVTSLWAGGNVHIPEDDAFPWVPDFVAELVSFPASGHDDQVDSMTQALRHLKSHGLSIWEALADG